MSATSPSEPKSPPEVYEKTRSSETSQNGDAVIKGLPTKDSGESEDADEKKKKKEDGKEDEPKASFGPYLKLWTYGDNIDRLLQLAGFSATIGAGAALPLMTIVFGQLVNVFNDWGRFDADGNPLMTPAHFRSEVNHFSLYFVYLFIAKFVLVYIHTVCFTFSSVRITRKIRLLFIKSILRQEIAYFDNCSPGAVATKISTNANMIQTGLGEKVGVASQAIAMLVTSFIIAFISYWKLTLVTAVVIPTTVIIVGITVVFDSRIEAKILDIYSKAGGLAEETMGSIRNVVAFGANEKLSKKYNDYIDAVVALGRKKGPLMGIQYSTQFFCMFSAYSLCFWYGVKLLVSGEIKDGGRIVVVFQNVMIATSSLTMIAPTIGEITKAAAAAKDVIEMINRKPEIDSASEEGAKPEKVDGKIEIRNVEFRYPARPDVQVLNDISIAFEARKTTALVGASGSGKSTIVSLVERWYEPKEGGVFLDGVNTKELNLEWLRTQIGMVQQEPVLFNDTIYENVAYGLQGTSMVSLPEEEKRELVRKACIEANAHDFISELPDGYDTSVGERAGLLSGGQKQRVCIARAIIKDPPILLLDEATSALDPKSEAIVQAALDRASQRRTTIVIAHRLSTVRKASRIVVMNKGTILEEGTHESLMASEGAYYRLVNVQTLSTKEDEEEESPRSSIDNLRLELSRVETTVSKHSVKSLTKPDKTKVKYKYSLPHCLFIIFRENRKHWPLLILALIASCLGGGAFPTQAVLFSQLIVTFQLPLNEMQHEANFWALMFFIVALAILFIYLCIGSASVAAAFPLGRGYRSQYFHSMIRQDIAYYDLPENSSGSLTARLSSDPQYVHSLIQDNLGLIINVIVNLISSSILALATGWKLALVAIFGALPPLFAAGFTRMRLELTESERTSKFFLESARFASEAVGSIRTVASLTLEKEVYRRYEERLRAPLKQAYIRTLGTMLLFGASESIDMAATGLTFWYGGRLLSYGEYSTRDFFVVFTAIIFGGQAAGFFFGFTQTMTKATGAANHIFELRSSKPDINASTGAPVPEPDDDEKDPTPAIEFRDVRFAYPSRPKTQVLRGLDLKIHRGQWIALVGPSGCGKTTCIALLERFYDITSGTLAISGAPLASLDVNAYRARVALVSQEPTLYQGSLKENICLGLPDQEDVPMERVEKAARDANIHDFIISLPEGYNTDVGSKGTQLSGGQRQRIAIARALIREPAILLLDEATSSLDSESEKLVQIALETASRGRTTVTVAHRLSTVRNADCICVFGSGKIVESGTHEDLVARRGVYYKMVMGQKLDRAAA